MVAILEFIRTIVPSAEFADGRPKSVIVPDDLIVADLLEQIERQKEALGITKYTVLIEGLEETMRKVIEAEEDLNP
jgi:hypothetical protein